MERKIKNISRLIDEYKRRLAETDFKAIKFAEGALTNEEFAPIRAKRQKWRDRINELESMQEAEDNL